MDCQQLKNIVIEQREKEQEPDVAFWQNIRTTVVSYQKKIEKNWAPSIIKGVYVFSFKLSR